MEKREWTLGAVHRTGSKHGTTLLGLDTSVATWDGKLIWLLVHLARRREWKGYSISTRMAMCMV